MTELTRKHVPVDLKEVLKYHLTGITSLAGDERKSFIRASKKFILAGEKLLYKHTDSEGNSIFKKVLLDEVEKDIAFKNAHFVNKDTHIGVNNTVKRISQQFYWVGIKCYVKERIEACDICRKRISTYTTSILPPLKGEKLLCKQTDANGNDVFKKVLLDEVEKDKAFKSAHYVDEDTHFGVNNTIKRISQQFYWVGITRYVRQKVAACSVCQKRPPAFPTSILPSVKSKSTTAEACSVDDLEKTEDMKTMSEENKAQPIIKEATQEKIISKDLIDRHHKAILNRMCRVCGMYCYEWNTYIRCTETFEEKALTLGVDASNDDPAVHPRGLCETCYEASTWKNARLNFIEKFAFYPHANEKCEICWHACCACSLVPKAPWFVGGTYSKLDVPLEFVQSQRHNALLNSVKCLQEQPQLFGYTGELLNKNIDDLAEHKNNDCGLCNSPCPLCGISMSEAKEFFYFRCKPSPERVKPLVSRKRKLYDEEIYTEPREGDDQDSEQTANEESSSSSSKQLKTSDQPLLLPEINPSEDTISDRMNHTAVGPQGPQLYYQVPVETKQTLSMPNQLMILPQPVLLNLNHFKKSSSPSVSQIAPGYQVLIGIRRLSATMGSVPLDSLLAGTMVTHKTDAGVAVPVANAADTDEKQHRINPLEPVEFGTAPLVVAETLADLHKTYGTLSGCIKQALSLAPHLVYKYKFIPRTNSSCQCVIVASKNDDLDELKLQLSRLDNYVRENGLQSRSFAIEELLFSYSEPTKPDCAIMEVEIFSDDSTFMDEGFSDNFCNACGLAFTDYTAYRRHFGSFAHKFKEKNAMKLGDEVSMGDMNTTLNKEETTIKEIFSTSNATNLLYKSINLNSQQVIGESPLISTSTLPHSADNCASIEDSSRGILLEETGLRVKNEIVEEIPFSYINKCSDDEVDAQDSSQDVACSNIYRISTLKYDPK